MQFEFSYLGVEHEQYFQGFGVSFTEFDRCSCGIGATVAEAASDAVVQICVSYEDIETIILKQLHQAYLEFVASLDNVEESTDLDDGFHHHVGIRWKSD